jgi:hypothetical protein
VLILCQRHPRCHSDQHRGRAQADNGRKATRTAPALAVPGEAVAHRVFLTVVLFTVFWAYILFWACVFLGDNSHLNLPPSNQAKAGRRKSDAPVVAATWRNNPTSRCAKSERTNDVDPFVWRINPW